MKGLKYSFKLINSFDLLQMVSGSQLVRGLSEFFSSRVEKGEMKKEYSSFRILFLFWSKKIFKMKEKSNLSFSKSDRHTF